MTDTETTDDYGQRIYVQLCSACRMENPCSRSATGYHEFLMVYRVQYTIHYVSYKCRWCRLTLGPYAIPVQG